MADDNFFWRSSNSDSSPQIFDSDRHVRYLEMMYELVPSQYESQEINRLTLAYFVISGLDVLRSVYIVDKERVVAWVLSFQAHPKNEAELNNGQFYGFYGSRSSQFQSNNDGDLIPNNSHLASTYCVLAILKTVGYDLSRIDSGYILKSIRNLQQPDGSFMPIHVGSETDLRFVYCAAAISFMLENWTGMDKEKAKAYVLSCKLIDGSNLHETLLLRSYDGGFGLIPDSESHGGATYCAVASLRLMGFIGDDLVTETTSTCIIDVPLLLDWILQRQAVDGGFQGRPNKSSDTCYAFWVGGVLRILGAYKFIDDETLRKFCSLANPSMEVSASTRDNCLISTTRIVDSVHSAC